MFDGFFSQFSDVSQPALLWAGLSPVIGLLLGWAARLHWKSLPGKTTLALRWYRRLIPLIAPTVNVLILVIGLTFFVKQGLAVDKRFAEAVRWLAASWFLIAFVHVLTHSRAKTLAASLLVALIVFLSASELLEDVLTYLANISFSAGKLEISALQVLKFAVSVVLLIWLAGALLRGIEFSLQKMRNMRASTRQLFLALSRAGIYALAAIVALSTLGIDLTAFAIFGGAVGVGLGFGLQKIASNFISGLILLVERSVEVGDMIEMHNGAVSGIVRQTGARYTVVETFDNGEIMVPNEDFITQRVVNWTFTNARGMIKMPISVAYGSDLGKARALMLEAAEEHPRCLEEPPPSCLLLGFTDAGISFQLNVWLGDIREKRLTTQSEILYAVWQKFLENGVGLPHSAKELHFRTVEKARQEAQR
jgi:small-conductance mechanosensitive channel